MGTNIIQFSTHVLTMFRIRAASKADHLSFYRFLLLFFLAEGAEDGVLEQCRVKGTEKERVRLKPPFPSRVKKNVTF